MSNWHESIPGQIQQFKAQEAQRKLAKLAEEQAELQRQKAAAEAQQKNRAQPDFQEKQVATERRLADLTEQVAQLTKALTESREEHVAARPHIPEGKGGPCVTCGTPISFNAQTCPTCSEPDAGRQVRQKREEEEAAAREAEARRRQEEKARRQKEEEVRRQKEEEVRRQKEEEARRQKEEEVRRQKEKEARRQKEEEARKLGFNNAQEMVEARGKGYNNVQEMREAMEREARENAAREYQKAADQGYAMAQNNLGTMYFNGKGVEQNYVTAYAWFNMAAANGEKLGEKNKGILAGKVTPEQIAKAQELSKEMVKKNPKLLNK